MRYALVVLALAFALYWTCGAYSDIASIIRYGLHPWDPHRGVSDILVTMTDFQLPFYWRIHILPGRWIPHWLELLVMMAFAATGWVGAWLLWTRRSRSPGAEKPGGSP